MTRFRCAIATVAILVWIGASPVGVVAAIIHYYRMCRR
jgi:hypothetical protein